MADRSTLRRSFPLFLALLGPCRWALRSWRRVGAVVLVCLGMAAAPPVWWFIQLAGLPDIGDPFDVRAFRAQTIPDDRNAFVFYRRAVPLFKVSYGFPLTAGKSGVVPLRWVTLKPEMRRWVDANREALALFRRGADCPDALEPSFRPVQATVEFVPIASLQRLALIEASRLESAGKMAEAWGWYRTQYRTICHLGSRGTLDWRRWAQIWHDELLAKLPDWTGDPRTSPQQLRQALDDVLESGATAPSDSYTLKAEYVAGERSPQGWGRMGPQNMPGWLRFLAVNKVPVSAGLVGATFDALSFWRREPERCRRLARLLTANRLAFYDLPPALRPSPDPNILTIDLYAFGPEAPRKAWVFTPDALDRWLDTSANTWGLINFFNWKNLQAKEAANRRALVVLLATELYRRDHNADPPTPEALVGPYLKSLPTESADEANSR